MKTHIATSTATTITVRGRDFVSELLGKYSFTEMVHYLLSGTMPTPGQTRILDACLVTMMEHGWTPTSLIARLVADSVPSQSQVGIAAGLLAVGDVFAGTMEGCGTLLQRIAVSVEADGNQEAIYQAVVADHQERKRPVPGFGHPVHKPDDPRTQRLFAVARENGAAGHHIDHLCRLSTEIDRTYGHHITINASGAVAALLLEIGIPPAAMRSVSVIARAAGLAGHLLEESETHAARQIWQLVEEHIPYEDPAT